VSAATWFRLATPPRSPTPSSPASPDLKKAPAAFTVKPLVDSPARTAPGPNGKTDDTASKWRETLSKDPWVEESLNILGDMLTTK
jgi:hypothetical protein